MGLAAAAPPAHPCPRSSAKGAAAPPAHPCPRSSAKGTLLLLALAAACAAPAAAQAPDSGERVQLAADDGWSLAGDYWPAKEGRLTFLLLHGGGGRRRDWLPLRRALVRRGFGALALDARGHGDSLYDPSGSSATWRSFKKEGQDNEWNRISLDLDAAARFLEERGVALSSVAVAGAEVGANVALKWAAVRPEIRLAVLLSPGIAHKAVLSIGAMRAYGPRPVLILAAEDDRHILLAAKIIHDNARYHSGERFASFWSVPTGRGTEMLDDALAARILDWTASPLLPEPVESSTSTETREGEEGEVETVPFLPPDPYEGR